MYCRAYGELYGLEHDDPALRDPVRPALASAAVVAAFVARALGGHALPITGDGRRRASSSTSRTSPRASSRPRPAAAERTYNLVGEEAVSVREVADTVRRLVSDVPIVHVPSVPPICTGQISGARAWRELGWQPTARSRRASARYTSWLAATNVNPFVATLASTDGSAAAVLFQEPGAL